MNSIQQFLSSLPPALICLVIGASVAAESGLTVGMILPGITALLLLGFFAHSTLVPLPAALITAIVAGLAGTSYAYLTGHRLGARARATRWGSWIGNDRWAQADEFFERRGALAVTVGQFVVGARTLVPRLAGMHGRRYSRFAAASVPAVLVWATGFTLAGYLAGASYQHVSASFGTATSALLVAVGTLTVLLLTGRWVARHRLPVHAAITAAARLPLLRGWARRHRGYLRRLDTRLSPRAALAVNVLAVLAVAVGLAALTVVATRFVTASGLHAVDHAIARWTADHDDDRLNHAALATVSVLRAPFAVIVAAVIAIVAAVRSRRAARNTTSAVLATGGAFAPLLILALTSDWLTPAATPLNPVLAQDLFPTQTAVITCTATLAAWYAARDRSWPIATTCWTSAAILTAALAGARIYSGFAATSDTLSAVLLGSAWTVLVTVTFRHHPHPAENDLPLSPAQPLLNNPL